MWERENDPDIINFVNKSDKFQMLNEMKWMGF